MKKIALIIFIAALIISCNNNKNTLPKETTSVDKKWWKEAVIYQLYPRSFKDTDGDGVGDLKGIIEKLDYIKNLGVDVVWLNPIYSSPNDDNGYDISDYRNIMQEFGTLADFDTMLKGMHERGIKLVMDLVVNHSSDEHEWFKQSKSSRDNPYRNYYHWWPAEKGTPNYRYSLFDVKGEAWKYDSITNAYYLHYFSQKQPDLNWENPKVRNEVYDIMRFWADKGVDGFRLDAFQFVAKDTTFPKLPDGFEKDFMQYYAVQDGLHDYLKEMNEQVLSKYDVMSVAEGAGRNFKDAHDLVDENRKELNMAYAFDGVGIAQHDGYSLVHLKDVFSRWDSAFAKKGWLSVFLANHDQARMVSRFGNDSPQFREASSKLLNTFILSMRGTPYCYYGDELGMTNIEFNSIDEIPDNATRNGYYKAVNEGADPVEQMKIVNFSARDNGRTPMQWDTSINAGFTTNTPWLKVNPNHNEINVTAQENVSNSCLNYFRKMVQLRKDNPVLVYGDYQQLFPKHEQIYAYKRTLNDEKVLVLLNFSEKEIHLQLPKDISLKNELINNLEPLTVTDNKVLLKPYQAVIYSLK